MWTSFGASLVAQLVKNPPAMLETWVWSLGWEDPLEKGKAQYSGLENCMDCIVHGIAKSRTWLSNFHFSSFAGTWSSLPTKVRLVKAMVFPVVMYGCESWTINKAEYHRIDGFELWCWSRPLDCKEIQPVRPKGNQSWIFIGRTDAEAETPILWPPDAKNWLIGKDPYLGKIEGGEGDDRGWDGWMASPTQWTWIWANSGNWWWMGRPGMLQSMGSQRVGHDWVTELNWSRRPHIQLTFLCPHFLHL